MWYLLFSIGIFSELFILCRTILYIVYIFLIRLVREVNYWKYLYVLL